MKIPNSPCESSGFFMIISNKKGNSIELENTLYIRIFRRSNHRLIVNQEQTSPRTKQ